MALAHAIPGEVVRIAPLGTQIPATRTSALLKSQQLEVVRVVLAQGQHMREHRAPGEITLLCIEGQVRIALGSDGERVMTTGDFLHLPAHAPHALEAEQDCSLLVTMCLLPGTQPG